MLATARCSCGLFKALSADNCKKCQLRRIRTSNLRHFGSNESRVEPSPSPVQSVPEFVCVTPDSEADRLCDSSSDVSMRCESISKRRKVSAENQVEAVCESLSVSTESTESEWLFGSDEEIENELGFEIERGMDGVVDANDSEEEPCSEEDEECLSGECSLSSEATASYGSIGSVRERMVDEGDVPAFALPPKIPCLVDYSVIEDSVNDVCANCHRCSSAGFDGIEEYEVLLGLCSVEDIRFSVQNWRTFDKVDVGISVLLCGQCYECLSHKQKESRRGKEVGWASLWPVYMWRLLTCSEVYAVYGTKSLEFVPLQWHGYWIQELHRLLPEAYWSPKLSDYEVTSRTKVVDVTLKRGLFAQMKKELQLGHMMSVCNNLLMPVCLCPWGCTCYYHDEGRVSMDAVFTCHFGNMGVIGRVCSEGELERVQSMRRDFLNGHIDCHLMNPDWSVYPSVYFKKGFGPVFLTCAEHSGGTVLQYFHLPRTGNSLPMRNSESLSPGVLRTRTLKATVPMKYSNGYRLQKCQASYCGIDTAYVSEHRNFDYLSHLEDVSEARAFRFRPDIRSLALGLTMNHEMSPTYFENLEFRSKSLFPTIPSGAIDGSTLMCLPDAIKLQRFLSGSGVIQVYDTEKDSWITFRPNWPPFLLRVQVNNGFGCPLPKIPMMRSATKRGSSSPCFLCFWALCHCTVSIDLIWEAANQSVSTTTDWKGFLLSFLSRVVTKDSMLVAKRRNPFYVAASSSMMTRRGLNNAIFGSDYPNFPADFCKAIESTFSSKSECCVLDILGRVSCSDDFMNNIKKKVSGDCKVIVVYGDACSLKELPQQLNIEGVSFELRLACLKSGAADANRPNDWTCELWCRYGGLFNKWWVTKRNGTASRVLKATVFPADLAELRMGIYVVVENVGMCQHRRNYLKYIGGQNHVLCGKHELPLITSYVKKGGRSLRCRLMVHGSECGRKEEYRCPAEGCTSCVCKVCYALQSPTKSLLVSPATESVMDDQESSSGVSETDLSDVDLKEILEEDSCNGSEESVDFTMLHTGCDVPMFDIEHAIENDCTEFEQDEGAHEPVIPTTHCGAIADTFSGSSFDSMGTSVLLNKFGTVLVRRDNRLQASKREKNLVERVASRLSEGTIPLVYMEAMLFPSIFWHQAGQSNGGMLGSIPTALFCQHKTRKRFRIASLADHAKVRLKGCASTASTNPAYLSFLFDSLANGALEGTDTRVVLSRGFEESMGPAGMRVRNKDQDLYTDTIDNRQNCHNLCASERDKRNTGCLLL